LLGCGGFSNTPGLFCRAVSVDVFQCGMCIYSKKCPCRTILAFLALLKKILRLPL
jgi:hypothetical protein